MNTAKRVLFGAPLCVALLLSACVPQEETKSGPPEVNYWEQRKGNCEATLGAPHTYDIAEVTRCMKVWEMYRPVGDLSVDMRSMYAVAFSLASYKAKDTYDKKVAEAALARLCIPRHPVGPDGKVKEEVPSSLQCGAAQIGSTAKAGPPGQGPQEVAVAPSEVLQDKRGTVQVSDVSAKTRKKAEAFNKKGYRFAQKKAFGNASDQYEQALSVYPHYVTAKYNYVCALAQMGDDGAALRELEDLYTWNDPEVNSKLNLARVDEDLIALRDNMKFKQLTGYFRLTLANGAGELGLEHLQRIQGELQARRYNVHQVVENKQPMLSPVIWYKPEFKTFADEFKVIVGTKKVHLQAIDWETLEDVIIVWGQPEAASLYDDVNAPVVQGTRAEEKAGGLGDITGAVKDAQGDMGDAVDTGQGVGDSVPK